MVIRMLVAIMGVGVIVQPGQDHRPAGAATRRGGEGMSEHGALGRQLVDRGRYGHWIAIATERLALVVGDEQHNVHRRVGGASC